MLYHVSIDIFENAAIERSACDEREEADDHGEGAGRR
jgi:hypothetical protein